jgi:hypothetical protein
MNYPITPPPELVQQWREETCPFFHLGGINDLATQAARWGADQELEACVEWLRARGNSYALAIATSRRPKPPTLKEQALATLEVEPKDDKELIVFDTDQVDIIRRALEALPND